ncbi:hypothetical protein ACFXC8_43210 [Streptomyces sp. NPDC059441]
MDGPGAVRALRISMWVLIMVAVPVYVVWLVRVGYLTGQHRLPADDVVRWAPPTLFPAAVIVLCATVGAMWWASVAVGTPSPLRERWPVTVLVFVAVVSAFCGVAAIDHPDVSAGLLSAVFQDVRPELHFQRKVRLSGSHVTGHHHDSRLDFFIGKPL